MRPKGKKRRIIISARDKQLSTLKLARKYGISKTTAYRIKFKGQTFAEVPEIDESEILRLPEIFILAYSKNFVSLAKSIYYRFELLTYEDAEDTISEALLRTLTYSYSFESAEKFINFIKSQAWKFARDREKHLRIVKRLNRENYPIYE